MKKVLALTLIMVLGCNCFFTKHEDQNFKTFAEAKSTQASSTKSAKTYDAKVSYYQNGEMLETLKNAINSAQNRIVLSLFELNYCDLIDCLVKASKRGVKLFIILDNNQRNINYDIYKNKKKIGSANTENAIENSSKKAYVKWEIKPSGYENRYYIYHKKLAIIDDSTVFIGSSNWTYAGFNTNGEINMMIKSTTFATQMDNDFINNEWKSKNVSDKRK